MRPSFVLDTNAIDAIVDDAECQASLRRATESAQVRLIVTSIRVDELLAAPDHARLIQTLLWVGARSVSTQGAVLVVAASSVLAST